VFGSSIRSKPGQRREQQLTQYDLALLAGAFHEFVHNGALVIVQTDFVDVLPNQSRICVHASVHFE
jgi:hypothetical protein